MPLDSFDRQALETLTGPGSAADKYHQLYGRAIGVNNASKRTTGVREYLHHKDKLESDAMRQYSEGANERVINGDGSQISKRLLWLSENESQDPDVIMLKMGFDPIQWELVTCKSRRSFHDVTIKNTDNEGVKHTNMAFLCEVKVKPLQDKLSSEKIRDVLASVELPPIDEYKYKPGRHWLELAFYDVHLAKRANGYDLPLAMALYKYSLLDILSRVERNNLRLDKITLPVGNDFYHVDNSHETTTAGTQMETNASWSEMYRAGVELLVWTMEQIRPLAPVHVIWLPGNHDETLSFCAAVTLEQKYAGVDGVTFDTADGPDNKQKYVHYGLSLVGLAHGDKMGKHVEHVMQDDVPQLWGATEWREWHLAHLHTEMVKSIGTLKFRRIPSITAIDGWHGAKGFRATRSAQSFVWDKDCGLDTIINSHVKIDNSVKI